MKSKLNLQESFKVQAISHVVLLFFALCAALPFVLLVIASFTNSDWAQSNGFSFLPAQWSLDAYRYVMNEWATIGRAYLMTILATGIGTFLALMITSLFAYAISHTDFPGMKLLNFMCIFTMLFNVGIVASYYIWVRVFSVRDTFAALIIPGGMLMSAFNVMLFKNYFRSGIPDGILEAARIDGAGEIRIFFQIVLPLSIPIIASLGLMIGIGFWNDWVNGLYYLSERNGSAYYTIQVVLNKINENIQFLSQNASSMGSMDTSNLPTTTARMAIAVLGIAPILIAYPFFQKYFVKGIMIGGVKE